MLKHACDYEPAKDGVNTRALQAYLGHRNIQNTTRYTALAPDRFKGFSRDLALDAARACESFGGRPKQVEDAEITPGLLARQNPNRSVVGCASDQAICLAKPAETC
jgi:hypothetical protein